MSKKPRNPKFQIHAKKWDDTFKLISWWDTDKVNAAKILVVGAGALGNEVLKNLALMNVGSVIIVDFDKIEYSNLSRSVLYREADCGAYKAEIAAKRIQEINPSVQVQIIKGDIMLDVGLGVFRRVDVVIGCLDNRLARLYINRHCHKVDKTWIDGAIEALSGQLCVYKPGISCYECQLSQNEWSSIDYRLGCADVAQRYASVGKIPTTPISSSIIAAMQVQEAIKVIHNSEEQLSAGDKFYYEGMNNEIIWFPFGPLNENCQSHFLYDPITEGKELSANQTVGEILEGISKLLNEEEFEIELDYEIVLEVTNKESEETHELIIAQPHLTDEIIAGLSKDVNDHLIVTKSTHVIDDHFPNKNIKLRALGVPELHILRIQTKNQEYFVELTGDENFFQFS